MSYAEAPGARTHHRAVAVMVQAAGIGRIVDEASSEPIGDDRWAAVYFDLIDRLVLH